MPDGKHDNIQSLVAKINKKIENKHLKGNWSGQDSLDCRTLKLYKNYSRYRTVGLTMHIAQRLSS